MNFLKIARNVRLTKNIARVVSEGKKNLSHHVMEKDVKNKSLNALVSSSHKQLSFNNKGRFLRPLNSSKSFTLLRCYATKDNGTDDLPPEDEPYNPQLPATVAVPEVNLKFIYSILKKILTFLS